MRSQRRTVAALAAVVAIAAPASASATVGYEPFELLDPSGTGEDRPAVAVKSDGTRLVAFANGDREVMLRTVNPDGTFGALQQLSSIGPSEGAGYPEIVVDSQDRATVVWYVTDTQLSNRVESARVAADGTAAPKEVLSPTGPDDSAAVPKVVVDGAGVATVVWSNGPGPGNPSSIQGVRLEPDDAGAPMGPVFDIDDPGGPPENPVQVGEPDIGIDPVGRVTVAWRRGDGDPFAPPAVGAVSSIKTARIAENGTVGAIRGVTSTPSISQRFPQVAVDPTGQATIAWTSFGPVAQTLVSHVDATTAAIPSDPVVVSDPARDSQDAPVLVADPSGRKTVAWTATPPAGGASARVEARRIAADGSLGSTLNLGPSEYLPRERLGAVSDALGRVTVAFPAPDNRLLTRRINADDSLSSTHRMTGPGSGTDEGLALAVDAANLVSVVWSSDGTALIRRSLPAPVPPDTAIGSPQDGATIDDLTPTFEFRSNVVEATFECSIDEGAWSVCGSPLNRRFDPGQHSLAVRSSDPDGTDQSPASVGFTVSSAGCDSAKERKRTASRKLRVTKRTLKKARRDGTRNEVKKARDAVKAARAKLAKAEDRVASVC